MVNPLKRNIVMAEEGEARIRLRKAMESKSSSADLDNRIITVISRSTGVSIERLRGMEKQIMDDESMNRR